MYIGCQAVVFSSGVCFITTWQNLCPFGAVPIHFSNCLHLLLRMVCLLFDIVSYVIGCYYFHIFVCKETSGLQKTLECFLKTASLFTSLMSIMIFTIIYFSRKETIHKSTNLEHHFKSDVQD